MATQHEPVNFIAGDTWEIFATCLDEQGNPFDLAAATVAWTLTNRNSGIAVINPADCIVTITNAAAGQCTITVPGQITAAVRGGVHQDALRLTTAAGVPSTLAVGPVVVLADPFKVLSGTTPEAAMGPTTYNLALYRGDTGRWQFKLWNDSGKTQPVDLTGATAEAMIRDSATAGTFALSMACTITAPNIIDMLLTAEQSATIPELGGVWDLQLTYPSGDITTVMKGAVSLTPDVTRIDPVAAGKLRVVQ